jgi:Holliday junction resolvase RusA-like endonuclease
MAEFSCIIPIIPQAHQSTRFGRGRAYSSKERIAYVKTLAIYLRSFFVSSPGRLLEGPLALSVEFQWGCGRKKVDPNRSAYRETKPDLDNLLKPLKDAMKGIVYRDDAQVATLYRVSKFWGPAPQIKIRVWELTESGRITTAGETAALEEKSTDAKNR